MSVSGVPREDWDAFVFYDWAPPDLSMGEVRTLRLLALTIAHWPMTDPPTAQQIADTLGYASAATVHRKRSELVKRGLFADTGETSAYGVLVTHLTIPIMKRQAVPEIPAGDDAGDDDEVAAGIRKVAEVMKMGPPPGWTETT